MRILIVGGDKRNLFMLNYFKNKEVDLVGYDMVNGIKNKQLNEIDISLYDVIIFPIDGVHYDYSITTKYNEDEIILPKDFLFGAKKNSYIFSGIKSDTLTKMSEELNYVKLLDFEDIKIENGILTSEGIIANIIYNTEKSIKDSNIVIFGYGRIGKPLVKLLEVLGANVKVGVIKQEDYENLDNSFYTTQNMKSNLSCADIIINTVPTLILDKESLKYINKSTYILDVSSYPYGIDFDSAKKLDLDPKILPGIPGAISPATASKILSKKIKKIVKES